MVEYNKELNRKPVCFDPERRVFIYSSDILNGFERPVPLSKLSEDDFKLLVVQRLLEGPDFTIQAISGMPMSRDDVVRAVQNDLPFGRATMEAEKAYLTDLLKKIQLEAGSTASNDSGDQ